MQSRLDMTVSLT